MLPACAELLPDSQRALQSRHGAAQLLPDSRLEFLMSSRPLRI